VTDLPARLVPRTGRESLAQTRLVVVAGAGVAVAAAGVGLAVLGGLIVLLWAGAPHAGTGILEAAKVAGQAWLAGHGVALRVPGGDFGVVPLGVTLFLGYAILRAGGWASRLAGVADLRTAAVCSGSFAAGYGGLAAMVSGLARGDGFRTQPFDALWSCSGLALVVGGLGVLRGSGLLDDLPARLPAGLRRALPAAGAALLVLMAGGALLTGVALALHVERIAALTGALASGWFEAAGLLATCVAFLPNAVLWAVALTNGPGFAVGAGTHVGLDGGVLGPVPALPLLAALPETGPFPPAAYGLLAIPAAAGAAAGLLVAMADPADEAGYVTALWAAVAGVLAGGALGLAAALAGGPAGGGRLVELGPTGWQVGLAAGIELALAAALTAGLSRWWSARD